MSKKIKLTEPELIAKLKQFLLEQSEEDFADEIDEYNPRQELISNLKQIINSDGEFDEIVIDEIESDGKPHRRARGSIYIDLFVPETEDKEFDRKVAMKMMEFYSKQINSNNYIGGVAFKTGDITNPFDAEF
jgi:hypothetical protein